MKFLEISFLVLAALIFLLFLMVILADIERFRKSKGKGKVIRRTFVYCFSCLTLSIITRMYRTNQPMKVLEALFLVLALFILAIFSIVIGGNFKKFIRSKKKYKVMRKALTSFLVCIIAFGALKSYNQKLETKINYNSDIMNKNVIKNDKSQTKDETGVTKITENENPQSDIQEVELPKELTPTIDNNKTSKGYLIEVKNGVTYIDGYLIVNKTYPLPEDYIPKNTHENVTTSTTVCPNCIDNDAYNSFIKMQNDMKDAGHNIWIASGYRSYSYQSELYNSYVKSRGKEAADTFSARKGHSEHQSGFGFDVCSNDYPDACINSNFEGTPPAEWLKENSYKYGFIIRYPKGKENITGYKYEPWHLRYVGTELASKIYNNGEWSTMEEYFGITSEYKEQ